MRIAHVQLDLGVHFKSIDKALVGQVRAGQAEGIHFDVVVVNETRSGYDKGVRYVKHRAVPPRLRRLSRLVRGRLLASVPELDEYDVVFLRYPVSLDLDPLAYVRSIRGRLATVHHAKEALEILTGPGKLGNYARSAVERVQGRRVLRRLDGIVGVTHELRDYQVARAGGRVPGATVSNGIDVSSIDPTGFTPYDGKVLRLVFVASTYAPWHGTDRLMNSLRAYRGTQPIELDLIGAGSGKEAGATESFGPVTVRHHGMLDGADFGRVISSANVAISTLAFHRTGLREGAVLKTRDYVARGMPIVNGYVDVDCPPGLPWVLQLPNDDSLIDVDDLVAFAERTTALPDLAREIRAHAERTLDWRVKVRRFAEFGQQMLDSPKRSA